MAEFSRRSFLRSGSGTAMAAMLPTGISLGEVLQEAATAPIGEGDRVRFASIGVGIEGSRLLRAAMTLPQAQCVAACDLYDGRLTLAKEIAGSNIRTTRRYQEILEDKSIEAVVVAAPDHWHKQITLDAIRAGKDVHCEKPMSHTIAEGDEMVAVVKESKNFVQVGSQRASSQLFLKAKELYDNGAIGEVHQVELQLGRNSPSGAWEYPVPTDLSPETLDWTTWQGSAPKKPFDGDTFVRWRGFREYGTGMGGDLMVHLLTGMQIITGINKIPDKVYSVGGIYRWDDGRNMPDLMASTLQYGNVTVTVRLTLGTETPEMTRIMGPKGLIEVSNSSVTLSPQLGVDRSVDYPLLGFPSAMSKAYDKQWHAEHDAFLETHLEETKVWKGPSWDDLRPHLGGFFSSVRSRKSVVEDVVFGHHVATACHMANASYFEDKVILKMG